MSLTDTNCSLVCSNNTPIDMLGLYKSVVAHGGLTANEAYDPAGRYSGTINWVRTVEHLTQISHKSDSMVVAHAPCC
jgi:hypothetical protein